MSGTYDNTNRGALYRNTRKEKDTHPDYDGKINVDGKEYWLNAWLKEGSKGKFFSLSVKPKDAPAAKPEPTRGGGPKPGGLALPEDDIPFAAEVR